MEIIEVFFGVKDNETQTFDQIADLHNLMLDLGSVSTLQFNGCFNCCWITHMILHMILLAGVTKSPKGQSSKDWLFEISKYRSIGYSFGHIDG